LLESLFSEQLRLILSKKLAFINLTSAYIPRPVFPCIQERIAKMCLSHATDHYIELAIDVFKTKKPALVISLKDFLTVLPNPKCVEEVLIAAIYQLAEADSDACRWLLSNSYYLEPEVDLNELMINLALTKLDREGFVLGQDFSVEINRKLYISEDAKSRLMIENSVCDQLLLEEFFQSDCKIKLR
jgi:hypothetical protein